MQLEFLEQRTLLAADFGDAPAPYPTLLANNGARHVAVGPTLGATRDVEADGSPSAAADGDGVDEDGVSFGTLRAGALGATVAVNVQGGAGKLDAWVDFNGDGSWGGPGERIFASRPVAAGNNQLSFDVPSWAQAGTTFARFRLSTAGSLGPAGAALDGEVEDYAVTITPPAAGSGVFGGQTWVSDSADGFYSLSAADIDGDGDLDVLAAASDGDEIIWYENTSNLNFTPHTISDSANGAGSVSAVDLDGDGDVDVLASAYYNETITWYENDGDQNFTLRTIATGVAAPSSVMAADIDGDGDLDILFASRIDGKIGWYKNDGSQNFTLQVISTNAGSSQSVYVTAADVDGDGDLDVLSASFNDDKIAWYENDGSQNFTEHLISTAADGARFVVAADVDGDGDIDVLSASSNDHTVAWYENDGSQNFTEREISTTAHGARFLFAADVDGDGDLDVLSSGTRRQTSYYGLVRSTSWYENDGSQGFTEHRINTPANSDYSLAAADVDGDGDLDLLNTYRGYDRGIIWFMQKAPLALATNTGATATEGSRAWIRSTHLSISNRSDATSAVVYTVTTPPRHGHLELTTARTIPVMSFTQSDIDSGRLTYQHEGSETTSDSFTFFISDGARADTATATFHLTITPAEGAPVLNTAPSQTLDTIPEDVTSPSGTLISSLLDGAVTDPDAGALRGIAVTAASAHSGTWQYTLDGTTWRPMGLPSPSAARLIPDGVNSRIRFIPKENFNGRLRIFYHAWDQTAGTARGTINVVGNRGGAKTLSFAEENALLTVTPVNDAPVLNAALNPTLRPISEDATKPATTLVADLLKQAVADPDTDAVRGIAVIAASDFHGVWQFSLNRGVTWQAMGAPTSSAARLLPADDHTRIRFLPKPGFHGTVKLYYRAWDQTQGSAGGTLNTAGNMGGTRSLSTAHEQAPLTVNDRPEIVLGGSTNYRRDAAAFVLAPFARVVDSDSPHFANGQLRVRIAQGASSSNRLTFSLASGFYLDANNNVLLGTTIIGQRTSNGFGTKDLIVKFNSNATQAIVQQLVRAISFKTVGGTAGKRTVLFTVADGSGGFSDAAVKTVNVT